MHRFGIAIELEFNEGNEKIQVSCSGIRLCEHYVLTHAIIIFSILKTFFKSNNSTWDNIKDMECEINNLLRNQKIKFKIYESSVNLCHNNMNLEKKLEDKIYVKDGYFEKYFLHHSTTRTFLQFLAKDEWSFDTDKARLDGNKKKKLLHDAIFLSSFIVIKTSLDNSQLLNCCQEFLEYTCHPEKGAYILIDSCPFGGSASSIFLNSVSQGIVGNISPDGQLFLTDARCIVGCEGAPAYSSDSKASVCGIVLSPFCWLKGEWVGLTFMAAIQPLLKHLMTLLAEGRPQKPNLWQDGNRQRKNAKTVLYVPQMLLKSITNKYNLTKIVDFMSQSIVRIHGKDERFWGSGVVVNALEGIIVSCAHVAKQFPNETVLVSFADGAVEHGVIAFRTHPEPTKGEYPDVADIAIIILTRASGYAIPLTNELPTSGCSVMIGGYPLFSASYMHSPTFSLGSLAKVCHVPKSDVSFVRDSSSSLTSYQYDSESLIKEGEKRQFNKKMVCHDWVNCSFDSLFYPVLLQTTCAVYSGNSGGPVVAFHPLKGPVTIGIVTSCAKDLNKNAFFPHVNLAFPSWIIAEAVDQYILTKDVNCFDILKFQSQKASSLWSLGKQSKL